jgi:type IV pilus assembly protein PilC
MRAPLDGALKMAEFAWEARGKSGEIRKGVMEAETENTVQTRLRSQQLNPTKVKKKKKAGNATFGSGVGQKDLVTFTRLFATMIDAGLPIVQCLRSSPTRRTTSSSRSS